MHESLVEQVEAADQPFTQSEANPSQPEVIENWDAALTEYVASHADDPVAPHWMGGAEVTLSIAVLNYYMQITPENADFVRMELESLERVVKKEEPDEETEPEEEIHLEKPEPKEKLETLKPAEKKKAPQLLLQKTEPTDRPRREPQKEPQPAALALKPSEPQSRSAKQVMAKTAPKPAENTVPEPVIQETAPGAPVIAESRAQQFLQKPTAAISHAEFAAPQNEAPGSAPNVRHQTEATELSVSRLEARPETEDTPADPPEIGATGESASIERELGNVLAEEGVAGLVATKTEQLEPEPMFELPDPELLIEFEDEQVVYLHPTPELQDTALLSLQGAVEVEEDPGLVAPLDSSEEITGPADYLYIKDSALAGPVQDSRLRQDAGEPIARSGVSEESAERLRMSRQSELIPQVEVTAPEEVEAVIGVLTNNLGLTVSPEFAERLSNFAANPYTAPQIDKLKKEIVDVQTRDGTHEAIKRFLVSINTIQKAVSQAGLIGKSVIMLYSYATARQKIALSFDFS